jgi:hypothetical protein
VTTPADHTETLDALADAAGRLGDCNDIAELASAASRLAVQVVPGVRDAGVVRLLRGERTVTLAATGGIDSDSTTDQLSLPVTSDADALVLRLAVERPLDTAAMRVARLFVAQLSSAVGAVHTTARVTNLERALETSRDIGVAMGIIMARRACTRKQAFELLKRASRLHRRKIAGLAADVVETGILEFELGARDTSTGRLAPQPDLPPDPSSPPDSDE